MRWVGRLLCSGTLLLSLACQGQNNLEIAQAASQELIDSLGDTGLLTTTLLAALKSADGDRSANHNADEFTDTLNARVAERCGAVAVRDGAFITITWDISGSPCLLGEGPQSISLEGVTLVEVSVEEEAEIVTFEITSGEVASGALLLSSWATVAVDSENTIATLDYDATLTRNGQEANIQIESAALSLENPETGGEQILLNDFDRIVTLEGEERFQLWDDIVLREGLKLPLEGNVTIEDAFGGRLEAILENTLEGVTLNVSFDAGAGAEFFEFLVDTEADDLVSFPL